MKNLQQLEEKYEELGKEIQALKKKDDDKGLSVLGWEPENAIRSYTIYGSGGIDTADLVSGVYRDFLGLFQHHKDASTRLALVKALCPSKVWIPEVGEKYWFIDDAKSWTTRWGNTGVHRIRLAQGNVHRTEEDTRAYQKVLNDWAKLLTE